jgi:hypothetical protein
MMTQSSLRNQTQSEDPFKEVYMLSSLKKGFIITHTHNQKPELLPNFTWKNIIRNMDLDCGSSI